MLDTRAKVQTKDRTLRKTTVLISGASIAGPALAFWLHRFGFDVTMVEKAAELRRGGQAVDFKGLTHCTVLERMGILTEIWEARVISEGDGIVVDAKGRKIATVPAGFSAGDIEIARGDLAKILLDRTATACQHIFGDSITSMTETEKGVEVNFERSAKRVFDLVVGADGLHSNVRRLAFGAEAEYVRYLGYYYALTNIRGDLGGDLGGASLMYNEPGRMVITGGSKAPALLVFASEPLNYDRDDVGRQKAAVDRRLPGQRLETPRTHGRGFRLRESFI